MIKKITNFISYKIVPLLTLDKFAPNVAPWNANFLNWYYLKKYMKKAAFYLKGICLDVGSGNSPYKKYLNVDEYISIDREDTQAVTYQKNKNKINADAKHLPFENDFADSVLLNQVLEHIDDYEKVLEEIQRVLKKNGIFVISVPFIYNIHSEPNDYFRFSEYGLRYLLKKYNFEIVEFFYLGYVGTSLISIWNNFLWQVWNKYAFTKFLRNTIFLFPILIVFFMNNIIGFLLDLFKNPKFSPNYLVICRKKDE